MPWTVGKRRPRALGLELGRSFRVAWRPAAALPPLSRPGTTQRRRAQDRGGARGEFTLAVRGTTPLPGWVVGASGRPWNARLPGRAGWTWVRVLRDCTARASLGRCRGVVAKRRCGPAPCTQQGFRGCRRCLFKVTACSGTTWGGQLGTGHLTDSGVTSGSPLVCGTRSA